MAIKFEDRKPGSAEKPMKAKTAVEETRAAREPDAPPAEHGPVGELPFGKPEKAEKKGGRKR